ncbi:MAG: hypothetical protein ACHQNV_04535 [Vicinamibacteria bacterium]
MRVALVLVALTVAVPTAVARDHTSPLKATFATPLELKTPVTLRWVDVEKSLAPSQVDVVSEEVLSLFRDLDVPLVWTRREAGLAFSTTRGEVPVIVLRVQPEHLGRERILGLVIRDHEPPSPVWVFVDNIRWTLGQSGGAPSPGERRELAVAVGRVVAHELVHALAPEHPHAVAGLMAPTLKRADLLAAGAPLDWSWVSSVRSGFAVLVGDRPMSPGLARGPSGPQ